MRWAVWQLSSAGTVHWELLKNWRLGSPTCRNALCPISAGVHSWKWLLSPPSSSTSAAQWKRFRCLKIPWQKMPVGSEFLVPLVQSQIPFPATVGTWILGSCHLIGWCVFLASWSRGSAVLTCWALVGPWRRAPPLWLGVSSFCKAFPKHSASLLLWGKVEYTDSSARGHHSSVLKFWGLFQVVVVGKRKFRNTCTSACHSYLQQVRLSVLGLCNCRKPRLSGVDGPSSMGLVSQEELAS